MKNCKQCDKLGTQLDLVRDELMRIAARIRESKHSDDPHLSSIQLYCKRAQRDIAVNYTPIQERDSFSRELIDAKARLFELGSWARGLNIIAYNPKMRREWHQGVGWLSPGQCAYVGNQKPEDWK